GAETATPRNAPCPCGSKLKFKRCCGINAPPVLHAATP
ncbi:MAG: SEC-C metal-binding domain-containing protein, partial [Bryobacteraceae bacterium]